MNGKDASEDLPCGVRVLVLQLAPPRHPRPEDPLVLVAEQGNFLEDPFVLAGGQGGFLEDSFALAGVQEEILAWVSRFLYYPAAHPPLVSFSQDVRAAC